VTTATDTWALGCILFELLGGRRPFEARTGEPFELERAILSGDRPRLTQVVTAEAAVARRGSLRAVRRRLEGDLANIVSRALAPDAAARYATAADLRADLKRWRGGFPVSARAPSFGYTMRKTIARHRIAIAGAAAVFVALVAGLAAASWQAQRAAREAKRAERVTEFLASLFEESDPNRAQGQTPTASEILSRGAARLETELADEPDLRADLLRTIGSLYLKLGEYEQARVLHEKALAIRIQRHGDDHMRVAESRKRSGARERHRESRQRAASTRPPRRGRSSPS
jgi:serine/threonine-protein kinase